MITHNRISGFLREKADREKEVVWIDGIGMETNYGTLVSLLSCLCVASVVVVCIVSGHYSQSIKFSGAEPGDSVATIELQTKVTASHEVRAVFSSQPPAFYVNRLRNHTLIVSFTSLYILWFHDDLDWFFYATIKTENFHWTIWASLAF